MGSKECCFFFPGDNFPQAQRGGERETGKKREMEKAREREREREDEEEEEIAQKWREATLSSFLQLYSYGMSQ